MIRGKGEFIRQDIVTALTASAGDVEAAFVELCRPPPTAAELLGILITF